MTADPSSYAILSAGLESGSARIVSSLEELCLDVIVVLRAMLDEGSPEDRIAVAKLLGPLMSKMNANSQADGVTSTADAAAEAREILAEMWGAPTP